MVYIGIDLGGTKIAAGVVDENGKILHKCDAPTGATRPWQEVTKDMAQVSLRALSEAGLSVGDVKAVGMGVPGIAINGVIPFCTNLGWHNIPMEKAFRQYIDKPLFIDNDATVAGLAESVSGVSAGVKNSVFITLGTGVGGGIVLDGKVYSGSHGVGSEIGHMITVAGGEQCTCGNKGCWERYASATAIIRMGADSARKNPDGALARAVNGKLEDITAKHVIDLAKAGDPDCAAVFDEYVYNLCVGLVSIINFIDPEVIALGGGVSAAGTFLLDAVRAKLPSMIFYKAMPYARIELATLGNDAGIIGAAMLGRE